MCIAIALLLLLYGVNNPLLSMIIYKRGLLRFRCDVAMILYNIYCGPGPPNILSGGKEKS